MSDENLVIETDHGRPQLVFGRYKLRRHLGSGAMGAVFEALDLHLGELPVALKILHSHRSSDRSAVERLRNEVRLGRDLRHPGIVHVYDFIELPENDGYAISMELITGKTLRTALDDGTVRNLTADHKIELLSAIAEAVGAAHAAGVIHRDLKPANIFITATGEAKVGDFGMLRSVDESLCLTRTGELVGTVGYASPEQLAGDEASPASDVYSLGVIGFEIFSGRRPYEERVYANFLDEVRNAPLPVLDRSTGIPPWLDKILVRATSKLPTKRPPNGATLVEELLLGMATTDKRRWRPSRAQKRQLKIGAQLILKGSSLLLALAMVTLSSRDFRVKALGRAMAYLETATGATYPWLHALVGTTFRLDADSLCAAIIRYDLTLSKFLIQHGVDPNSAASNGKRPLAVAAAVGNSVVALQLLEAGARVDPEDIATQQRILTTAVNTPQLYARVITRLPALGFDLNLKLSNGNSPLTELVRSYRDVTEAVYELTAAGARADVAGTRGRTAVHIYAAFAAPSDETLQMLLAHGGSLESRDDLGFTALLSAVGAGKNAHAEQLLRFGANPNAQTDSGATALQIAAVGGNLAIVRLLLQNGADPNIRNKLGDSALDMAAVQGLAAIVEALLAAGANADSPPGQQDPLSLAVENNMIESVEVLLRYGANPDTAGTERYPPLLFAIAHGQTEVVRLLLAHGAPLQYHFEDGGQQDGALMAELSGNQEIAMLVAAAVTARSSEEGRGGSGVGDNLPAIGAENK